MSKRLAGLVIEVIQLFEQIMDVHADTTHEDRLSLQRAAEGALHEAPRHLDHLTWPTMGPNAFPY